MSNTHKTNEENVEDWIDRNMPRRLDGDGLKWHTRKDVVDALTLKDKQFEEKVRRAVKDEWQRCVALLTRDHSSCPIKETCIGYQNAQGDLMNEPPELLKKIQT